MDPIDPNKEQVSITHWYVIETPSIKLTGDNFGNVHLEPFRGMGTPFSISDLEMAIDAYYQVWRPDHPDEFIKIGGTI